MIDKDQFKTWLFNRDPQETFNYCNPSDCCTARFLAHCRTMGQIQKRWKELWP